VALEPPVTAPPARSAAARRRTSRRGLILSVLVIVVGGLLAFAGGQMLTRHTRVLAVARDVPVGVTLGDADLAVASVTTDPNLAPIPASDRARIVGMVARVPLVRGELLTRGQVGPAAGFGAGQVLVALALKPGQYPARGLAAGQKVLIVPTPGAAAGTGTSTQSGGSPSGANSGGGKGVQGTVADVGAVNQASGVSVIDVRVEEAAGPAVAQLASTGNLALILLPAGR
jgi:hypothetical protein